MQLQQEEAGQRRQHQRAQKWCEAASSQSVMAYGTTRSGDAEEGKTQHLSSLPSPHTYIAINNQQLVELLSPLVIFIFNQKKLMRYVNMRYVNMNINMYIYNCG